MQISNNTSVDSSVSQATIANQVDVAVALKARQVQVQQGKAAVDLVTQAVDVGQQLASGHIDIEL